jgi:hypothetical protein
MDSLLFAACAAVILALVGGLTAGDRSRYRIRRSR